MPQGQRHRATVRYSGIFTDNSKPTEPPAFTIVIARERFLVLASPRQRNRLGRSSVTPRRNRASIQNARIIKAFGKFNRFSREFH